MPGLSNPLNFFGKKSSGQRIICLTTFAIVAFAQCEKVSTTFHNISKCSSAVCRYTFTPQYLRCKVQFEHNSSFECISHDYLKKQNKGLVYIHINILGNTSILETISDSKEAMKNALNWIIVDTHGEFLLVLPRNYELLAFGILKDKVGFLDVNFTLDLIGTSCSDLTWDIFLSAVKDMMLSFIKNEQFEIKLCHRLVSNEHRSKSLFSYFIVTPPWRTYGVDCYGIDSLNNTYISKLTEGVFVYAIYGLVYIIICLSPIFLLLVMDKFETDDNIIHFYKETDIPYGAARGLLALSRCLLFCMPKTKESKGPLQRACFFIWFINLLIYCIKLWFHIETNPYELKMVNDKVLSELTITKEIKIVLFVILYTLGVLLIFALIKLSKDEHCQAIVEQPMIFCLTLNGRHCCFKVAKRNLYTFDTLENPSDIGTSNPLGRELLLLQLNRFFVLFNHRLWVFVFKKSFSFFKCMKSMNKLLQVAILLPVILLCCCCFIFSSLLNLVWGLFPVFGFLLTGISTVQSCCSGLRLSMLTIILHFFIQFVYGENLLFLLNTFTVTVFAGIPSSPEKCFPVIARTVPCFLYLVHYWNQLMKRYQVILQIMFELRRELKSKREECKTFHGDDENEIDERIRIRDFNAVCEKIFPLKEQMLQFLAKIAGTVTFLLLAMTIIFWKKSSQNEDVKNLIMVVFVFVIPKITQYACEDSDERRRENMKQKICRVLEQLETHVDKNKSNWTECCCYMDSFTTNDRKSYQDSEHEDGDDNPVNAVVC